jgi:ribose transport system substrate-binding protein
LEHKRAIDQSFLDLDIINKFESFEDYPNTKPVVLSNSNGAVFYANSSFTKNYGIKTGDSLFDFNSEPSFSNLFRHLSVNNISSFCSDILIEKEDDYFESYLLSIEKVKINGEDLFISYIDSHNNRKKLTQKFNTYNQALESVNVGVLIADNNGNVKYVSQSFEKFFNIRIEDIYNQNLIQAFKKYLSELELNDLDFAILERKNWVKVISEYNSDGNVNYKEIRLNVIQDNIDNTINFIITANDITKHIKQTRLIKQSEQRQKSIINNISDPILILRKEKGDLIIESANNNFYKEILVEKTEAQNHSLLELVNPVLHSIIHEAIINLDDSNRIHAPFHYTVTKNKKRYLGKITYTDDQYDNDRLYIVNMSDITEQLEIERKLREAYKKEMSLNKLKSTFLANMSHEIRTPLNALVGYSDLLEDDVKSMNYESSSKMTAFLKDGVNRLLKLVDNIVEVSLLESGNQEIELDKINLNYIINSNQQTWKEQAKLNNINVYFQLSENNLNIEANEEKLERAIKELVDNAIKYNKDQGKVIVITFEEKEEIHLQISDTGIGIERESLSKILQLFEQVEETGYTRKYEGAGLGLSLANKLVSFMNGKMQIASQPNEGTLITISFPKV